MNRPSATATIQIDNEQIRVTRWDFPANGETGWHLHEMDYVVVPLTTGPLLLETAEGEVTSQLTAGVPYHRTRGAEHNVVNAGESGFAFIEIELK